MGRGGYASLAGAAPINSFGQDFLGGAAAGEKMRQVVGDIQIDLRGSLASMPLSFESCS